MIDFTHGWSRDSASPQLCRAPRKTDPLPMFRTGACYIRSSLYKKLGTTTTTATATTVGRSISFDKGAVRCTRGLHVSIAQRAATLAADPRTTGRLNSISLPFNNNKGLVSLPSTLESLQSAQSKEVFFLLLGKNGRF